ncbi:hypothetical protein U0070_024551 [Myodes glareolus]|uniref:Uncharacterized protein n=1 Tax=Myodes glareolus TaxID=447135 RepID=A0AAW0I2K4_MYOGA
MGISWDNWYKHSKTRGKRKPYHKKQKYELGRPGLTLRLALVASTRIIDVIYNASNNELVRTKNLVKICIVLIDNTPY